MNSVQVGGPETEAEQEARAGQAEQEARAGHAEQEARAGPAEQGV